MKLRLEFESKPAKRLFHRCQACGSEWPTSTEYCRRCGVCLGWPCNNLTKHYGAELHSISVEEDPPHYAATMGEVLEAKAEKVAFLQN